MTRPSSRSRWSRLALTVVTLASFAAFSPVAALAQSASPAASPAASGLEASMICDLTTPDPLGACLATATPIEPDDSLVSPTPVPFEHVTVAAHGRTLTVYFWMGVQECNGLHSVEVVPTEGGITLTVLTGIPEDAISRICIELAQLYSTVVTLDAPLVVDGTAS